MSVNQDSHTVGEWIREHCLQPRALTVGAVADLLGIARPTLSKILNGRMELSAAVAARLETVFTVNAKELLEKQLQMSDSQAQTAAVSEQVRRYVPRFLEVRAGDLVRWADTLDARARLSVLLRRLVHSTGMASLKKPTGILKKVSGSILNLNDKLSFLSSLRPAAGQVKTIGSKRRKPRSNGGTSELTMPWIWSSGSSSRSPHRRG